MDLRVTDGVTNVVLDGEFAPVVGCIYFPQGPNPEAPDELITETVEVSLSGTVAAIRATLRSLNLLFLAAVERAEQGVGPRIFVEYAPTIADALWRAEIASGGIDWSDNKDLRNLADAQAATVVVTVNWKRAPFWEGQLTQATLTNGNGSNNTTGLTIRLHDDGTAGHDNYVEIDAAEVTGDLLAPAEIHLRNTFGAGVNYRNFYLANNWFDPSLGHIIEGESRDTGFGSVGASAQASNGQYAQFAINGTLEVPWTLAATTLAKTRGRYLRLLAKFFFFDQFANIYVTAKIKDAAGNITLAQAEEEVRLQFGSNYLQNLGVLPFPPGGYSTSPSNHKLVLAIRTESLQTVSVDFMQLTPTFPPGCYRELKQLGNLVPNNEKFVDDGIEGISYVTVSGQQHFVSAPKTAPLLLWPNRTQRIYVQADGTDVTIDHTLQMQLWFRARRSTI